MDKVKITFTEDRIVQDEHVSTERETKFVADKSYSLDATSADRWVKRGVAVYGGKTAVQHQSGAGEGDGSNGGGEGQGDKPGLIEIPDDWATQHHAKKRKWAREISGQDPADLAAAEAVIAAEVERRAAEAAQNV